MADLYSKVTLRPRSKLERVLELLQPTYATPKRSDSSVVTQIALFYLIAAEVTPADASKIVKTLHAQPTRGTHPALDGAALAQLEASALAESCPERTRADATAWLRALGHAAIEGLEEACQSSVDEARKRVATLPRMTPETVDLILLSSGAASTVAPSAGARRVACRLGYPGSTYAALSRALDAEVPEGDATEVAWRAHHLLAQHGRDICLSAEPRCDRCALLSSCSYRGQGTDPASRLSIPGV